MIKDLASFMQLLQRLINSLLCQTLLNLYFSGWRLSLKVIGLFVFNGIRTSTCLIVSFIAIRSTQQTRFVCTETEVYASTQLITHTARHVCTSLLS